MDTLWNAGFPFLNEQDYGLYLVFRTYYIAWAVAT
jgi:hypothetical protein